MRLDLPKNAAELAHLDPVWPRHGIVNLADPRRLFSAPLGSIPEGGVEQPADPFACSRCEYFGRPLHPTGQRNDRQCRRSEYYALRTSASALTKPPRSIASLTILTSALQRTNLIGSGSPGPTGAPRATSRYGIPRVLHDDFRIFQTNACDQRERSAAALFEFQCYQAGNRDGEIELADNRFQIGQAAGEGIDRHDVAVTGHVVSVVKLKYSMVASSPESLASAGRLVPARQA